MNLPCAGFALACLLSSFIHWLFPVSINFFNLSTVSIYLSTYLSILIILWLQYACKLCKLHCIKRWNKTVWNKNEIREICVWNILLIFSYFKIKLYGITRPLIQLGLGKCKFCASQAAFSFYTFVCTTITDFSPMKTMKYVKIT